MYYVSPRARHDKITALRIMSTTGEPREEGFYTEQDEQALETWFNALKVLGVNYTVLQ